jgi:hypothetical protein
MERAIIRVREGLIIKEGETRESSIIRGRGENKKKKIKCF